MSKLMENEVYNAAVNGDLTIFSNKKPEELLNKTYESYNILHIAAQHKQINFIKAALNNFPSIPTCESLTCDSNCHGNTPLHVAAMVGDHAVVEKLYEFFSTQCSVAVRSSAATSGRVFPWRVKNKDGNTPAHVALRYCNISVAMYLVEKDGDYLAREINSSNETLLHLAIQYHVSGNNGESEILETNYSEKSYQSTKDIWPIIELLLKLESSVTCWANVEGLTPLHQATSLEPADYCQRVIKAMLASRSEAANVHEKGSGHTMLHLLTNHQVMNHEQARELLSVPHVYALKDTINHQGDTPLHLAARNRDTIMVQVLLESSPKLCLKNKSGVSAASLVKEFKDFEEMRNIKTGAKHKRRLSNEDYEAAKKGDIFFLRERMMESLGKNFLDLQTSKGQNILHVLLTDYNYSDDYVEEFTGNAIQLLSSLIIQQDCDGNTCVHMFAEKYHLSKYYIKHVQEAVERDVKGELHSSPWRLKNNNGDTPLHVAVRTGAYVTALMLLEADEEVAGYVNNRKQTPLHLLNNFGGEEFDKELDASVDNLITRLIKANNELPYMQDGDGLTPLLGVVKEGKINIIRDLYKRFIDSSMIVDYKGRTLWHLMVDPLHRFNNSIYFEEMIKVCKFLIQDEDGQEIVAIKTLMVSKDNDGNTPLHYAILNRQFGFAKFLLDNTLYRHIGEAYGYKYLLQLENNVGDTPYTLIGSAEHLPYEFERALFKHGNLLRGHRSMYGVPTTKIEEYSNTIGVIAALLTTITFTAAFTVPGGVNSTNGAPLLIQHATFQMFMVADIVAMCTSVMVLFCLLWIMTTSNKKESILLLDVSVFLIQTSFYATLVTFMMGLYVTCISIVPAIAISTCVACTLLIILMHKRLVMLTVVPFFEILILLGRVLIESINNYLSSLWIKKTKVDEIITPEVVKVDEMKSEVVEVDEMTSEVIEVDEMKSEVAEVDEVTSEVVEVDEITPEVAKVDKI